MRIFFYYLLIYIQSIQRHLIVDQTTKTIEQFLSNCSLFVDDHAKLSECFSVHRLTDGEFCYNVISKSYQKFSTFLIVNHEIMPLKSHTPSIDIDQEDS